jgi:clan AA aspartic protease
MGIFATAVRIGNPDGGDRVDVEALVDTGASDSMFPASLLEHLHLYPRSQVDYVLADGSEVTYGRGRAVISIGDREEICPVAFGPEGDGNCLIGATALQILMFAVDPTNEVLIPTSRARLGYGGSL